MSLGLVVGKTAHCKFGNCRLLLTLVTRCITEVCALAQVFSHSTLTMEMSVRSQSRLREIYGGHSGTRTGFSLSNLMFLLLLLYHYRLLLSFMDHRHCMLLAVDSTVK
jgi:hypothetical protein